MGPCTLSPPPTTRRGRPARACFGAALIGKGWGYSVCHASQPDGYFAPVLFWRIARPPGRFRPEGGLQTVRSRRLVQAIYSSPRGRGHRAGRLLVSLPARGGPGWGIPLTCCRQLQNRTASPLHLRRPLSGGKTMTPAMSGRVRTLLLPFALVTSCALFFAYLLTRYSYDGLYGQDAYAYYYQAQALWSDITGQPQPPNARSTSDGFRWPIGYHLHIIAGFLFGGTGPEGGRLLTLLLAAATPLLVYFILHQLWPDVSARACALAGLSAGAIIMLTGTYTR